MVVSVKDSLKLVAVSIVCCCAVFVCTFMLNFYLDVLPLGATLGEESKILYDAQLATAKFTSAISGGFLGLIAVVMTVFYIKIYIDGHSAQLGILKAMGYSEGKLALRFWVFGLSVLLGCVVGYVGGYIAMPFVYEGLKIDGIAEIPIGFHPVLFICLVILPPVILALIACLFAYFRLKNPVMDMIKGRSKQKSKKVKEVKENKKRGFLLEMGLKTLSSKKMLAFFVAFACFCFSAMVQMGLSMDDLMRGETMGIMILVIGVVLAVVSMIIAVTSLINGNKKNVAIMKAFGYSLKECSLAIFLPYIPVALIGFAVGTGYQYGLLYLMINLVFKDVGEVPDYTFNLPIMFITLALFIVAYLGVMLICVFNLNKVTVKEVMQES